MVHNSPTWCGVYLTIAHKPLSKRSADEIQRDLSYSEDINIVGEQDT